MLQVLNKYSFLSFLHLFSLVPGSILCCLCYCSITLHRYIIWPQSPQFCPHPVQFTFRTNRTIHVQSWLEELGGIIPDLKDQHSVSYFKVGLIVKNRVSVQGVSLLINSKLFINSTMETLQFLTMLSTFSAKDSALVMTNSFILI